MDKVVYYFKTDQIIEVFSINFPFADKRSFIIFRAQFHIECGCSFKFYGFINTKYMLASSFKTLT